MKPVDMYDSYSSDIAAEPEDKRHFIEYIIAQQGEDYVNEQGYKEMALVDIVSLEKNHYNDFVKEEF